MKFVLYIMFSLSMILGEACEQTAQEEGIKEKNTTQELSSYSKAYFASGCFWCVEAIYESVTGVEEVISGYAGGEQKNPTYDQVAGGRTTHAEAVEVYYDPDKVSFATLIDVFYGSQDPTTVGQSPDFGPQYRSIIFYSTPEEKEIAEMKKKAISESGIYKKPIVTEIKELEKFYKAEAYHQDFEARNPNQRYIVGVSKPRLEKFKKRFPGLVSGH
ncbi:MAG: peptide-methionine (S)-S-oxide reductase MsrA [Chitinophagales bacterium]|nr:peptide-methionine (S)-S-oxide reductase MsrA [Chitinophagales bacterium]